MVGVEFTELHLSRGETPQLRAHGRRAQDEELRVPPRIQAVHSQVPAKGQREDNLQFCQQRIAAALSWAVS